VAGEVSDWQGSQGDSEGVARASLRCMWSEMKQTSSQENEGSLEEVCVLCRAVSVVIFQLQDCS
jgi:hypothetical protein